MVRYAEIFSGCDSNFDICSGITQNKDKSPTMSPTTNTTIPFGLKPRSGNGGNWFVCTGLGFFISLL